jgi:hypothetical protein
LLAKETFNRTSHLARYAFLAARYVLAAVPGGFAHTQAASGCE